MLENIRVVLVETSHTGNMGSVARAMKTMGLSQLYLVNPLVLPDSQAISLAAGASDIIGNAHIVETLCQAVSDCALVVGTSARSRSLTWPMLDGRACAHKVVGEAQTAPTAMVFGRERIGLTNEELQLCHFHVALPTDPGYSSLNLAMAVQILCYEVRLAWLAQHPVDMAPLLSTPIYPPAHELEQFYQHLQQTLLTSGFLRAASSGKVMSKLRRLFARARLERDELNILRGALAAMQRKPE